MISKLISEFQKRELESITRRHFIRDCVSGMGTAAFGSMLLSSCKTDSTAEMSLSDRTLNPLAIQ